MGCSSSAHPPTYRSWAAAKERCRNPNCPTWDKYGGRGITFSNAWNDYTSFLADMGERPAGSSIDRIDNNRGYEPGNCRWATRQQQNSNRRNCRIIRWRGQEQTLTAWAKELGLLEDTLRSRILFLKWSVDRALSTPARHKRR